MERERERLRLSTTQIARRLAQDSLLITPRRCPQSPIGRASMLQVVGCNADTYTTHRECQVSPVRGPLILSVYIFIRLVDISMLPNNVKKDT